MIKIAMVGLVNQKRTGNVVQINPTFTENVLSVVRQTKLNPSIFVYKTFAVDDNLVTNAAIALSQYDGVIALGLKARKLFNEAEDRCPFGPWTWIPDPNKLSAITNKEAFFKECSEMIHSFVFRVQAEYEQTRRAPDDEIRQFGKVLNLRGK